MVTGNVGGWHDDQHELPMKNYKNLHIFFKYQILHNIFFFKIHKLLKKYQNKISKYMFEAFLFLSPPKKTETNQK